MPNDENMERQDHTPGDARGDNAAAASTETQARTRPRRLRWLVLGGCLLAALALAGTLGGRFWISRSYAKACEQAERDRDWKQLEAVAGKWAAWRGNQAQPWIYLAQAAQEQGDLPQAVEYLDQLPPSDPLTPLALVEQSTLLFGPLNRPIQGAESCERALALNPRLPEAYRRVVYFYTYTLQRGKMASRIYDAIAHDCDQPEMYLYLVARDYLSLGDAYEQTTKWLKGAPDEELLLVAQAYAGIKAGAFTETEERQLEADGRLKPAHRLVVEKLLARFPRNLELLVLQLQSSSADGDAEQVAKVLSSSPPAAVEDGRFWRFKGWLHNARGELVEAETAYRKALEINPYDIVCHQQMAAVERRLHRKEQAEMLLLLAKEGQGLRETILHLPDAAAVDRPLLERIGRYAANCGDEVVARRLYEMFSNK